MKVIVIGGGAAGLFAGYLLKAQGVEVQVLEARSIPGGRIHTDRQFADYPIEWGAAYFHGHNHVFYELATHAGSVPDPEPIGDYYNWKGDLLTRKKARQVNALRKALGFFDGLYRYEGPEVPLADLWKNGKRKALRAIFEGMASEYGAGWEELGAASLAAEEREWAGIGGNYILNQGIQPVFDEIIADLGLSLRCNSPVAAVDYGGEAGVSVQLANGEVMLADKVIVTVPLSVLKARTIAFEPALPPAKLEAITSLGMGMGMKVFLKFDAAFWRPKMRSLFGGKLCPLYEVVHASVGSSQPSLKAYLMGPAARTVAGLGEQAAPALLDELDGWFNGMASRHFIESKTINWSEEPYIWGAYSYAAPHSAGQRYQLALPVNDCLYFAGEATHFKGFPATVQGAMESAAGAVETILGDS